jgi:hypothetical protein
MKIRNIAVPVEADAVPFADCHITEEAQAAALRVLRSGWVTTGREVPGSPVLTSTMTFLRRRPGDSACRTATGAGRRRLRDRHTDAGRRARGRGGEGGMATTDDPERPPGGMTGANTLFEQLPPLLIYPRQTDDQVDAVCTAIADTVCRQFSRKGAE